MKKKLCLLLLPVSLLTLVGCGEEKEVTRLTYGNLITTTDPNNADTKIIHYADLALMMDETSAGRSENFILVLTNPDGGCTCWESFRPVLKEFIKKYQYNVYQMNYEEFEGKNDYRISYKKGYVSLAIVKGGEVLKEYPDANTFTTADMLKIELDKYIEGPNIFYIDQDLLNSKIKNGEKALVYHSRSGCGDCGYIAPHVLYPYSNSHKFEVKMYAIDLEEMYQVYKTLPDEEKPFSDYQTYKDNYFLSANKIDEEHNAEKYGFGNGVVPTFQAYESGVLKDACVSFNDKVEVDELGDDEKTSTYKVTNSYYDDNRVAYLKYLDNVETKVLKGMKLNYDDLNVRVVEGEYRCSWKKESSIKYHQPILEAFLDKYSK